METLVSLTPTDFRLTATGSYSPSIGFTSFYPIPRYITGALSTCTPEQVGSVFLQLARIETWPYMRMTFSGSGGSQTTQYSISDQKNLYGSGLIYGSGLLNRIYIQGNKRSTGKEGYVDDSLSIGSLNSADTRNAIHKNVALLLR
jgi:hypothetical protein